MLVYIIAFDKNQDADLLTFIRRQQILNHRAYFFCGCHREKSRFGIGALFNTIIQMAGLSNNASIIFYSLKHDKMYKTINLGKFVSLNGFDNFSNRPSLPICQSSHGYNQIYASSVTQKGCSPYYIYTLGIDEDRILNTDIFRCIDIEI